jgi:hypothetical protein
MGTGSFPGVKWSWGVLLTTHPFLALRSWKSRAIPLPTLWAANRPVTGLLYVYLLLVTLHRTTNFKKIFVSVMNMLLIYLFAYMKLEKGHKNYLAVVLKLATTMIFYEIG